MDKTPYKVLIVDDEQEIRTMLELVFSDSPYEVTVIDNGLKAYEIVENEHFDIVISDIAMPEMDGLTLLRKIKQFNGMIQVIMMTAYITLNNTLNAFRYGAVDIFFKPFEDPGEILAAVDAIAVKLDRINSIMNQVMHQKRK